MRLGGPQSLSGYFKEEKNFLSLPEIEPRFHVFIIQKRAIRIMLMLGPSREGFKKLEIQFFVCTSMF
jgi:hypothetical protein